MNCENCGKKISIKRFKSDIYDNERWCSKCQDKYDKFKGVSAKWITNKELFLTNPKHTKFLNLPMFHFDVKEDDIVMVSYVHTNREKILVLL
jgi:hypothetical protein